MGPLLFCLAPLNLIFRYIVALLSIFGFYCVKLTLCWKRNEDKSVPIEALIMTLRWLFAHATDNGYLQLPGANNSESGAPQDPVRRNWDKMLRTAIGQFILNGALLRNARAQSFCIRNVCGTTLLQQWTREFLSLRVEDCLSAYSMWGCPPCSASLDLVFLRWITKRHESIVLLCFVERASRRKLLTEDGKESGESS